MFSNLELAPNNNIQTLDLDFKVAYLMRKFEEGVKLRRDPLEALNTKLISQLSNLQSLRLNFDPAKNLSDEIICNLIYSIASKLSKLENLHLLFSNNLRLTDEPIHYMIDQFCYTENLRLPSIKNILIAFSYCKEVSGHAVEKLEFSLCRYRPELQSTIVLFDDAKTDSSWNPEDLSEADWMSDDSDDSDENLMDFLEKNEDEIQPE